MTSVACLTLFHLGLEFLSAIVAIRLHYTMNAFICLLSGLHEEAVSLIIQQVSYVLEGLVNVPGCQKHREQPGMLFQIQGVLHLPAQEDIIAGSWVAHSLGHCGVLSPRDLAAS